jgi:hypothetical protein
MLRKAMVKPAVREVRIELKDERYRSSNQSDKSGEPSIKRSIAAADKLTVTFPKKGELPIKEVIFGRKLG